MAPWRFKARLYNGDSTTGRTDIAAPRDLVVLVASALFWAWFDSGVFRPTFLAPFPESSHLFLPFLVGAIASGGAVLLVAYLADNRRRKPRGERQWGAAAGLALAGSALSILGGAICSLPLTIVGSIGVGASCGFFQLAWGNLYTQGGSTFSGKTVSLSIALGVLTDCLVMGLNPRFAMAFTAVLPLASAGLAGFLLRTAALPLQNSSTAATGQQSPDAVFGSHRTIGGLPVSLLVAFALFGLSFGYCQHSAVFFPTSSAEHSSDALITARGITAFIICMMLSAFPQRSYAVFKTGTLIGIAGFVAAPLLGLIGAQDIASSIVVAVGYTTFDIATWALVAELAHTTQASPTQLIGCGRSAIHLAECLAIIGCASLTAFPNANTAIGSTIGYGCVVAEMLLLADNSALWLLIKSDVGGLETDTPNSKTKSSASEQSARIPELAKAYSLTERESEVLTLLLAGHGRARVAQALGISENTLGTHIQQLYRKLDVHSRQELLDRFGK